MNQSQESAITIYIHWPFCASKCPYCDFNSYVLKNDIDIHRWKLAYLSQLQYFLPLIQDQRIKSIFFGGGTPSLMPLEILNAILLFLFQNTSVSRETEISIEVNPTSFEYQKFESFSKYGINRVSIGLQSLNDDNLHKLGRNHSAACALEAVRSAKEIFDRVSFDVIYGLMDQSLEQWREELEEYLALNCSHLSLYMLTIETGTGFAKLLQQGRIILPQEEALAQMYTHTMHRLKQAGYDRYEISNFAKPSQECAHNLHYWRYGSYLGLGPGAHSRIGARAMAMHKTPSKWIESVEQTWHGLDVDEQLSQEQRGMEMIMMGLRLRDGIERGEFLRKIGVSLESMLDEKKVRSFVQDGLLKLDEVSMYLTDSGVLLYSYILNSLLHA
ncbi:Coproporphyrinogen III oxidase [Rickettsiales endosymbiont of Paramecium tredecaurelia]|uniref:radical SAM family heme chaperone HemW n=1 Tax=Candidatus Sarmatiella mevalonica TaxID=2770581 RepID=UPI00192242D0|nr:radical SAM family heme chaperone HemW [Candidatus Sarmatiella mevalonica]MBL3284286.1 Coproporphyrinogen III oxidase [Candidatus Sarmatiella mevalonica]